MNFNEVSSQIMRALRGDLSQQAVNKSLNVDFNLIAKIETGNRKTDWQTFCRLCKIKGSPLKKALEHSVFYCGDPLDETLLFNYLCSEKDIKGLSNELSFNASKIRRKRFGEKYYWKKFSN